MEVGPLMDTMDCSCSAWHGIQCYSQKEASALDQVYAHSGEGAWSAQNLRLEVPQLGGGGSLFSLMGGEEMMLFQLQNPTIMTSCGEATVAAAKILP